MQIVRIHHAQVTAPKGEEEAARAFYCGVLGLKEINKPAELEGRGGFWVQVGDRQLHIGIEEGVEVDQPPEIPGYERFEFRDPFGNRIEFTQPIAT